MDWEPAQLRLLALIDTIGTLTGAADELGITAAAVTQQVAKAELRAGVQLVIRSTRGARLSPAGIAVAEHGRTIDVETRQASATLDNTLGVLRRSLRVGAIHAAALHLLPPALTALRHRHPSSEIAVKDITSDQAFAAVERGELDLAVLSDWGQTTTSPPRGVVTHHILHDPMIVVLPDDHPRIRDQGKPRRLALRTLRDEAWVAILSGAAARRQFDAATRAAGFQPDIRFETESYDIAQALVSTGIGVAMISRLAHRHTGGTAYRVLQSPTPARTVIAATRADVRATPLATELLHLLRDVAAEFTQTWHEEDTSPA